MQPMKWLDIVVILVVQFYALFIYNTQPYIVTFFWRSQSVAQRALLFPYLWLSFRASARRLCALRSYWFISASSERLDDTHRRRVGYDHNNHTFFTSLLTFENIYHGFSKTESVTTSAVNLQVSILSHISLWCLKLKFFSLNFSFKDHSVNSC